MNISNLLLSGLTTIVSLSMLVTPVTFAQSKTIFQRTEADTQFQVVVDAIVQSELKDTLNGEGDFTVFMPTDKAVEELGETFTVLLKDENKGLLRDILLYHTLPTNFDLVTLQEKTPVTSSQSDTIDISTVGDKVLVNGNAEVIASNIETSNGRVHVINKVILSQNLSNRLNEAVTAASNNSDENTEPAPAQAETNTDTESDSNSTETSEKVEENSDQENSDTSDEKDEAAVAQTPAPTTSEDQNTDTSTPTTTDESQDDLVRTGDSSLFTSNVTNTILATLFIALAYAISKQVLNRTIPFKNI